MQKMKTGGLCPDIALGLFCCSSRPNFTSNEELLFGAVPRRIWMAGHAHSLHCNYCFFFCCSLHWKSVGCTSPITDLTCVSCQKESLRNTEEFLSRHGMRTRWNQNRAYHPLYLVFKREENQLTVERASIEIAAEVQCTLLGIPCAYFVNI